jgi:hypothetical protein
MRFLGSINSVNSDFNNGDKMKTIIILVHAIIGWGLCGAVIAAGRMFFPIETTLIIHVIAVPIIFTTISLIYFKRFSYTSPFTTALIFLGFAAVMDFFVVAMLLEKSFEMFRSIIGTWIPFVLIFLSTYLTGYYFRKNK